MKVTTRSLAPYSRFLISTFIISSCFIFSLDVVSVLGAQSLQKEGIIRVRLGELVKVDSQKEILVLVSDAESLAVYYDSRTLFFLGNEEEISLDDLKKGSMLYIFGSIDGTSSMTHIEKIIVKNNSKLSRKIPQELYQDQVAKTKSSKKVSLWEQILQGISLIPNVYVSKV